MTIQLPASVAPFAKNIIDVDTHEMMPAQVWVEYYGEMVKDWADIRLATKPQGNANDLNYPGYPGDTAVLTDETLWKTKGVAAPGATDMQRRIDVMDRMGVSRQLVFGSGVGGVGTFFYGASEGSRHYSFFKERTHAFGISLMDAYNRWAVDAARVSPRIRPVAPIYGETPAELTGVARSLIDGGIRAVVVVSGRLPANVSPASNELDGFYAMLAEADVPLTLHLGGELSFFRTLDWSEANAFKGFKENEETTMDPWRLSALHLAPQNFIATMVTGGVFDRHPTLRVGVLEYGAHWVGPMADMLDLWHDHNQSIFPTQFKDGSFGRRLPMRPSEYISRNVRVTAFDFEPVGKYIARFGLEDVYCFASDYPHIEGGFDPIGSFAASLEPLGSAVIEKFFVKNGELLLPA